MSESQRSAVVAGTVVWFSDEKGTGFIKPADGGPDVFVHQKDIAMKGYRTLSEGQSVRFTRAPGRNDRSCAVNVEPLAAR